MLKADGFNEAIIGECIQSQRIIYDYEKMIEILMKDMTQDEAMEYFDFNILGAYVGEYTPIYLNKDVPKL
jgi:hypothetical protein